MSIRRYIALGAIQGVVVAGFVGLGMYASLSEPVVKSDRLQLQRQVTLYGSDDFSGPVGAKPNPRLWTIENRETASGEQLNYNDPANVKLDGRGHLEITAYRAGDQVVTGSLNTFAKLDVERGMVQARMKMPRALGVVPSFWMLGSNILDVGYPGSGAINVANGVDRREAVQAQLVGPWISASPRPDPQWKLSAETGLEPAADDGFHIYWLRKEKDYIVIGVDDVAYGSFRRTDMPEGGRWVQNLRFFLGLSLGVTSDAMPKGASETMLVDWVRIYG